MKKILIEADFAVLTYDPDLKLAKIVWNGKATTKEYQHTFITLLEYSKEHKTENFISDLRKQAVVSPENRNWFETVVIPRAIELGLIRAAVIFDGNVFKKYYLNMILKVLNKYKLPLKLFNSDEEANEWITSFTQ
jgi:hypothetical protein